MDNPMGSLAGSRGPLVDGTTLSVMLTSRHIPLGIRKRYRAMHSINIIDTAINACVYLTPHLHSITSGASHGRIHMPQHHQPASSYLRHHVIGSLSSGEVKRNP